MENKNTKKYMSAEETAELLSQTMRDVVERKITLRHALTISRLAVSLTKVIEVVDLKNRVELLEQILRRRK